MVTIAFWPRLVSSIGQSIVIEANAQVSQTHSSASQLWMTPATPASLGDKQSRGRSLALSAQGCETRRRHLGFSCLLLCGFLPCEAGMIITLLSWSCYKYQMIQREERAQRCPLSGKWPTQLHTNWNSACYWSQKLQQSRYRGVASSKLEPLSVVGQEAGLLQAKQGGP